MIRFKRAVMAAILILPMLVCAQSSPKRDFRSSWLTTVYCIDWPTTRGTTASAQEKAKNELIAYLDSHQKRNFTGVCFQVRTMGDALYKSNYEPWSSYVSGTRGADPGWDPLAFALEECHKRGLECYAWVNPFRYNLSATAYTTSLDKSMQANGWFFTYTSNGSTYTVFNPANSGARKHIIDVCRDIYTRYRVDGLVFDDYFYPNGMPATTSAVDYSYFKADNPSVTSPTATQIRNWRREKVNSFMRELYKQIQADRPDLRFGIGPAGIARKGAAAAGVSEPNITGSDWQYDDICSDPIAWMKDGSIDFIAPQVYWFYYSTSYSYAKSAPYDELSRWWNATANHFNRHAYISIAAYNLAGSSTSGSKNNEAHWKDISMQIQCNRQYTTLNAPGSIFYSAKYMDGPALTGWGNYLQANSYQEKSLVPIVAWKSHSTLSAPSVTKSGNTLSWNTKAQTGCDPIMRYTVYAVPASISREKAMNADGDGLSNKYLAQVVYGGSYEIPANLRGNYWYAVCAYDGYGYESTPCFVDYSYEPPVISRDETAYDKNEEHNLTITNLWYRSASGNFDVLDYDSKATAGTLNRGIAIYGDKLYLSGRTESAGGSSYLREYGLETGEYIRDIPLALPSNIAYPCNDVFNDNKGNMYVTNITLNAASTPLSVYRFDPENNKLTQIASLTCPGVSPARIDHASVYIGDDRKTYVFAAISSSKKIVRWQVNNLADAPFTVIDVAALSPSSSENFGIAPRIFPLSTDLVVVNGGSTFPAEYQFSTGKLVSSFESTHEAIPTGREANGFAHFGVGECFMCYPNATHTSGFNFKVVKNSTHGFGASAKTLWTIPSFSMGTFNSTTMSAPVAQKTVEEADGSWTSYLGVYAAGNALAVYKVGKAAGAGITETGVSPTSFTVSGNTVWFPEQVGEAAAYTVSGQLVSKAKNADHIDIPSAAGIYIVICDGNAQRVVIR